MFSSSYRDCACSKSVLGPSRNIFKVLHSSCSQPSSSWSFHGPVEVSHFRTRKSARSTNFFLLMKSSFSTSSAQSMGMAVPLTETRCAFCLNILYHFFLLPSKYSYKWIKAFFLIWAKTLWMIIKSIWIEEEGTLCILKRIIKKKKEMTSLSRLKFWVGLEKLEIKWKNIILTLNI